MSAPHLEWLQRKLDERREELEEPFFFAELLALARKLKSGQGHIYGAIFPSEAIVAARKELLPKLKQWLDDMRARGVQMPTVSSTSATRPWLDMHSGPSGWFHVPDLSRDADDKLWQADFDLAMRLDIQVDRKRVRYRGERIEEADFEANVVRAGALLHEVAGKVEPFFDVERMYLFDFNQFNEELYEKLRAVQQELPGYIAKDKFFGEDPQDPPLLKCVVEPSGLHVSGCLRQSPWDEWHAELAKRIDAFPLRLITSFE